MQRDESQWFSEQVIPHGQALRAYLSKRFPSLPDHDDLVQESFSRTVRARRLGRLTHVKGFLFTAARNIAIDMLRGRTGHERVTDEKMLPLLDEEPSVCEKMDRRLRRQVLVEAVQSLPPRCREVMLCRYVEGLSYKEIAARLGLSTQTVKAHLVKGVRDCGRFFQERGLLETGAMHPNPS